MGQPRCRFGQALAGMARPAGQSVWQTGDFCLLLPQVEGCPNHYAGDLANAEHSVGRIFQNLMFSEGRRMDQKVVQIEGSSGSLREGLLERCRPASVGAPSIAPPGASFRFPHRAAAAFFAISLRC